MLYHEVPKQVNQLFVLTIDKKINDTTYQAISRNYFTINDTFEVLSSKLSNIVNVRIIRILNRNQESIKIVNTPMSELIITFDQKIDLQHNDILRKK
jgi:hypothetical protein